MSVINKRTTNNITLSYGKKPATALTPKRTTTIFSITSREVSFDLGELLLYYKYTRNFFKVGWIFSAPKAYELSGTLECRGPSQRRRSLRWRERWLRAGRAEPAGERPAPRGRDAESVEGEINNQTINNFYNYIIITCKLVIVVNLDRICLNTCTNSTQPQLCLLSKCNGKMSKNRKYEFKYLYNFYIDTNKI